MLLFLSYADEDRGVAEQTGRLLRERGASTCSRWDQGPDGGGLESTISGADTFLAIMSPSYMRSPACRRERELAFYVEDIRRARGRDPFIYVLEVRPTLYNYAGLLQARPWFDLIAPDNWHTEISALLRALPADADASPMIAASDAPEPPSFRNRERELTAVLNGLTRHGQHFWLVTAPPQFGKSWFLDRIATDIQDGEPNRWTVRLVDVRDMPPEVRTSVEALLGMLLGSGDPVPADQEGLVRLASALSRAGRFHLCLLDGAELLDRDTARELRSCLSRVHQYLMDAANRNVRLCLLVASRSGEGWTGIGPPRLTVLRLTGFEPDVIAMAMQETAARSGLVIADERMRTSALDVHRLSEGLPALLYQYLNWVRDQRFVGLERLRDEIPFYQLTQPYIEQHLLSSGNLFGPGAAPTDEQRAGVETALRTLVPYRLITQSHLTHQVDQSDTLRSALDALGWPVEKLWDAVVNAGLFDRPQSDAWEVVNAPLRGLLCRYWYPTENSLAYVHESAAVYVWSWGRRQHSIDQGVALIESLWHYSQLFKISRMEGPGVGLIRRARKMSRELTESGSWSRDEIRRYAVNRMAADGELEAAVTEIGGSIDQLSSVILQPGGGEL